MRRRVVHFIDTAEFGGAERALLLTLGNLDRSRWEPILVHHGEAGVRPLVDGARALGVEALAVPKPRSRVVVADLLGFMRSLRRLQADLFHAHMNWPLACTSGLLAARAARVPVTVATVQLFGSIRPGTRSAALRRLHRGLVDHYIAVSEAMAGLLRSELQVVGEKVTTVHNGIELGKFAVTAGMRARTRATLAIQEGVPVVLTVARLERQKGHHDLIDAAAAVPNAVFLFAGDGPDRGALEQQARGCRVADRVRFLGARADVPDLLAACDLFVLPSIYEGFPLALLEAMAAGRAVLATRIGGVREIITEGESGLLVEPAAPTRLAAGINALLANPEQCARLGAAAVGRARRHSAAVMASGIMSVYEQAAESTHDAREAGLRAIGAGILS